MNHPVAIWDVIIHSDVGHLRCLSYLDGQCESPVLEDKWRYSFPRLLFLFSPSGKGSYRQKIHYFMFKLKKLFFVLPILMVAMFAFASCSDDDDDDKGNANSNGSALVGSWVYYDEDADDIDEVYTFNSNGTGVYFYENRWGKETESFKWTADDKIVTITYDGDDEPERCSYSISGNILILDGDTYRRK